jgi:transposase
LARPVELEEVLMAIVGGLDVHRKQITFDCLDTETGELQRGRIAPADRVHLADWLAQLMASGAEVHLGFEGCTGWRYVAEELARAGVIPHLAEPADTAALRGRRRRPKTDRTDARHLRQLLADGRLPQCWIPPTQILECRALLETYHDLRTEHTAWVQRIHAVLFHHGARRPCDMRTAEGHAELAAIAAAELSPTGQLQVTTALAMLAAVETQLNIVQRNILDAAHRVRGAKVLRARLYGVGPITALALTCWLGGPAGSPRPASRSGSPGWMSPSTPPTGSAPPGTRPGKARRCCAGAVRGRQGSLSPHRPRPQLLRPSQRPDRR